MELGEANELGALGAAIVAATGAGLHPDLGTAAHRMVRVCSRLEPDPRHVDRMNRRFAAYGAQRDALDPLWDQL